MPATFFIVRAVVVAPLCEKFDHWTSAGYLPRAADARALWRRPSLTLISAQSRCE